jgi:hypothetical protein
MSTKTTFKRLALVTVAALGLGVLSVAPSSAVVNADTLTLSATTAAQTTAETATATSATATLAFLGGVVSDSMTVTASLVSGPATSTALPYLQLVETVSASIDNATLSSSDAIGTAVDPNIASSVYNSTSGSARVSAKYKIYLAQTNATTAPTVAGTYVVKLTPAVTSTGALNSAAQTITITVTTAASLDTVAASADIYLNAGETNTATVATVDATNVTGAKTASSDVAVANISVALKNAAAAAVTAESFTATITGPGTLGIGRFGTGQTSFADTYTAIGRALNVKNGDYVMIFPDGTSGVSTVTIASAAGKILGSKSVTFHGDAATITAKTAALTTGTVAKVGANTGLISFTVADAAGTSIKTGTYKLVSADTTIISNTYTSCTAYDATNGLVCDVTGVAKGTTTVYVTNKTSATDTTAGTIQSAPVSVRVGTTTPAAVKVSLDKSSYAPGEKATLTVALTDADGNAVPSGAYTGIFATGGIVSSYALDTRSDTTTATGLLSSVDGVKTYTLYMPVTEGDVKFSWTTGSVTATGGAGLALANQAKDGSVTVAVSSAGTALAIDAANEATDAANAATDAALAAADAADAATAAAEDASAAVAKLAKSVNTALKNLKKQITSLTALVNKLLKK